MPSLSTRCHSDRERWLAAAASLLATTPGAAPCRMPLELDVVAPALLPSMERELAPPRERRLEWSGEAAVSGR